MAENNATDKIIHEIGERSVLHAAGETAKSKNYHLDEFKNPDLGPVLDVNTKEDLLLHYKNTVLDAATEGFIAPGNETNVYLYNKNTNTAIMLGPAGTDGGTILRPEYRESWLLDKERRISSITNLEIYKLPSGGLPAIIENFEMRHGRPPNLAKILDTPLKMKLGFEAPKPGAADLVAEAGTKPEGKFAGSFDELAKSGEIAVDAAKAAEAAGTLGKAVKAVAEVAGPALKVTGKVVKFVPLVGTLVGVGVNTAEAAELNDKLQTAISEGRISEDALLEYDGLLAGHIAQGGDPSVIVGEAGVQTAFNLWADKYDVQGDLRDSLQPSSLALMIRDGALTVGGAAAEVGRFAIEKAGEGLSAAGHAIAETTDNVIDTLSGEEKDMREVYAALPVLAPEDPESDAHLSPTDIERAPVYKNPPALALAEIKTGIDYAEKKIEAIQEGREDPLGPIDKKESVAVLERYKARLEGRFEKTYEDLKAQGSLPEVHRFVQEEKMRQEMQKSLDVTKDLEGPAVVQTNPQAKAPEMDSSSPYYIRPSAAPGLRI